ncbi:MAG: AAA family ATPase [Rhodoferax sp.]
MKLLIEHFAQIEKASVDFGKEGDLTLLVGQQATGKSLLLQWLKLTTDRAFVRSTWEKYSINWKTKDDPLRPLDLFFGEGLGKGYVEGQTRIQLEDKIYSIDSIFDYAKGQRADVSSIQESTYYIPAHRALLLADGWPLAFQQHRLGTPYVARAQSERLLQWLNKSDKSLFPIQNRLQSDIRDRFNDAIFHGAQLNIDRASHQSRLVLTAQQATSIPYMAWTAGQREFVPLLIALYELLPAGGVSRLDAVKTVILEEPELGLHPKALFAVGIAIIHLLARGYRVVVSSHSPLMVDFAWTLNRLRIAHLRGVSSEKNYFKAFNLKSTPNNKKVVAELMKSKARAYYLGYSKEKSKSTTVTAQDISDLRTYGNADEPVWGELLRYSTLLAEVIGQLDLDFSALTREELIA